MKKLIFFLVLGLVPPVGAQSIDRLTQQLAEKTQIERKQRLQDVRERLTYKIVEPKGIDEVLATPLRGRDRAVSSSFFFKQLLSAGTQEMGNFIKNATPEALDPSLSLAELKKKMTQRETEQCIAAMNRQGFVGEATSDMDKLLVQIIHQLVLPQRGDRKRAGASPRALNADELKIVNWMKSEMARLPLNRKGLSVAEVLGHAKDLELFGNRLRALHLSNSGKVGYGIEGLENNQVLSLQLSMLISYRTGQDEAFVKVQRCLVEYLTHQSQVFARRLNQLKKSEAKSSDVIIRQVRAKSERNVQSEDGALEYYFEGYAGTPDKSVERDFIESRLAKISEVLPYLSEKVEGAIFAHGKLGELSTEQMDGLIDLFLHLNRDDIPVVGQVDRLKEMAMSTTQINPTFLGAISYYQQMDRDLIALQNHLEEEESRVRGQKEDLEIIKRMPRP